MCDPASEDVTSSRVGSIILSRFTARLSFFKSTQMRTCPDLLITGTIGAHHSVGFVIRSIMPTFPIRSSYAVTFGSNGIGTLPEVVKQGG